MQTQRSAIANVEYWPVGLPRSKPSWVVLRVTTEAGIAGWGEVAIRTDAGAVARCLDACRRDLLGQDVLRLENLRSMLGGAFPATDRDEPDIQAAFNMAALDILGKQCRAPVYEVLGGPTRNKARAMALLTGDSENTLTASLGRAQQAGFRAVRVPLSLPTGPTRGRGFFERTRRLLDQLRSASGGNVDFVLDCGNQTTPAEAVTLANVMEDFHLLWMDEPVSRVQQESLSGLAAESATPVGWGRHATSNSEFQYVLRQDAVDVLRPDICRCGITSIRKAAAIAETYYVAMAPYHAGGPIATAAALHIAASIPNFYIQEVPFPDEEAQRRMRRDFAGDLESAQEGFFRLPSGPGLGVTISDETLQKYRIDV